MSLKNVDDQLFAINKRLSLNLLIPKNLVSERNKFFKKDDYNPVFRYNDHSHISNHRINISDIESSSKILRKIFSDSIKENNKKIDLFSSIGKSSFVECSKQLYGRPSKLLVDKAYEIVQSTRRVNSSVHKGVNSREAVVSFKQELRKLGFNWHVSERNIIANAIVNPPNKQIMIKKGAMFSRRQIKSLIAHEIYGHILRSECGLQQPYKLFSYGLADYESTEEGLAMFNEELRGSLLKSSLRGYAGRVIAVDLASRSSFRECYEELRNYFGEHLAFVMTLRAKRGMGNTAHPGAFTKDFLYLNGYFKVREYALDNGISSLYYGKVALGHVDDLDDHVSKRSIEGMDGGIVNPKRIFDKFFKSNVHPFENLRSI